MYKPWWVTIIILIILDTVWLALYHGRCVNHGAATDQGQLSNGLTSFEAVMVRQSIIQGVFWIVAAFAFAFSLAYHFGVDYGLLFINGYWIEKILSFDNAFVFYVIFQNLRIPPEKVTKLLTIGIIGALVLRGLMIEGGIKLLNSYGWLYYVLGGVLALSGIALGIKYWKKNQCSRNEGSEESGEPIAKEEKTLWIIKILKKYSSSFSRDPNNLKVRLIMAVAAITICDVFFAIDSIPCIFAVTNDPFLIYSSNIFAVLGMRSLFNIVSAGLARLPHLQLSLSFILSLIGLKLVFDWPIPSYLWFIIISSCFFLGMFLSPKAKIK